MSKVSEFPILPYIWNQKYGNLGNFSITLSFESSCEWRIRDDEKKMN